MALYSQALESENGLKPPDASRVVCLFLVYLLALTGGPADAHEFWLQPIDYRPRVGASVPIVQRAGTEFAGLSYPYLRDDTLRFSVIGPGGERAIKAIEGDDPAAEVTFTKAGLTTVVYHGAPNFVVFDTFAKFEESLKYEHLDTFIGAHQQAGKPQTKIKEQYSRYAKTLVSVGKGDGLDKPIGLPLELVAERNPYELKPGEKLSIRLLFEGKPLPGITIKLFSHANPAEPGLFVTDEAGSIAVDLPKTGEYLVHTVHMREPRVDESADWISLWASLTFARP